MEQIYYIGGSPCSGKSSIAERLQRDYGLEYYKQDDGLFTYMEKAAAAGLPHSMAALALDLEQMWMRPPALQRDEELALYEEMLPWVLEDLEKLCGQGRSVVAEGAGLTPALMRGRGVDAGHYVCIVPSEAFQREKFAQRPWIGNFLAGCSDPEQAFDNWMSRDALFAVEVRRQAGALGYTAITVDGSRGLEEIYAEVAAHFGLAGPQPGA